MKRIMLSLLLVLNVIALRSQTAKVQFIHDSPDIAAQALDIWVNNTKIADSLNFRYATPYMNVTSNQNVIITIQNNGLPDTNAALLHKSVNLSNDSNYVMVISGVISAGIYDSLKPFDIDMHRGLKEAKTSGEVDVLFYNGGPDTPPVGISDSAQMAYHVVDSMSYGFFSGYKELPSANYNFHLEDVLLNTGIADFDAPFDNLGYQDSALVVVTSGFIDTTQGPVGDSSSGGVHAPLMGLWAALPSGGQMVELPLTSMVSLVERSVARAGVYPMPVHNVLNIVNNQNFGKKVEINILNSGGQLVFTDSIKNYGQPVFKLYVYDLKPGIHLLILRDENNREYARKIFVR